MTTEGALVSPTGICVFEDIMAFCLRQTEHANAVSQNWQADLTVAEIGDRREISPSADSGRNDGLGVGASERMGLAEGHR
jgi:hypothetical protein